MVSYSRSSTLIGPASPTATATGIEHEELVTLDEEQGVLIEAEPARTARVCAVTTITAW